MSIEEIQQLISENENAKEVLFKLYNDITDLEILGTSKDDIRKCIHSRVFFIEARSMELKKLLL